MAVIPLADRPGAAPLDRAPLLRCSRAVAAWMLAGAAFAVVPKCPACLVVWIAIATGFGVSLSTAGALQTALYVICVAPLACLAIHFVRMRLWRSSRAEVTGRAP